jgi:glycosyltransferase involved in cell wall biosynthesis
MRVLMITQKVDLDDGILGFTHTWVNKLAERVERLYVLALAVGKHSLRDNVELFSMGKERGNSRLERWVSFNRVVARLVLARKVDLVFIHMCPRYAILATPYAKLMRVPMVMWFTHRSVNSELRLAHWLVDKVVTASKESFRLKSDKVVITGHGIDTDRFKPLDVRREGDTKVILAVGRISPIKDYETLIETANILVNERGRRDLRFIIMGNVPAASHQGYFEHLQEMVAAHGLTNYLSFVGAVPHREIPAYYQNCDVLVNLCPTGGLDKVVLEGMACAKPVIVCNETFGPILGKWANTLMFKVGDARSLANRFATLERMSDGPRRTLGCELRAVVAEHHSIDGLTNKLTGLFDAMVMR